MGCGSGQKQTSMPVRLRTVTGKLKITITSAVIFHSVSSFKMDPYVILKLSNQVFNSKVIEDGDKNPNFSESFSFFINSCYQTHGRNLEVALMDRKKIGGDAEIGFGIVDLDPIVNFKKPKDQFRCFLNYDRQQAGLINIIAEFQEQPAQTLNFRFETASIRRKTSTFGDMNCWVKATIGEEVLQTTKQKDTKQMPPVWSKEILVFNVPKSAPHVNIIVMDDSTQVGRLEIPMDKLLSSTSQQAWNEEFEFNNSVNAGTLKFQTISGTNPVFSEIKQVHKKVKEEPKKVQQKPKQEPKKEQPKKEQPKKEEPKKEQPKKEEPAKEQPKKTT